MTSGKNEIDDTKKIANSVIKESMVVFMQFFRNLSLKEKKQKLKESMMGTKNNAQLLEKDSKKVIHLLIMMLQTC